MGVFATRATHRPNPVGMSVVALERIVKEQGKVRLQVSGLDLVDGTPVLDIKPYLPYADGISDARGGFAETRPDDAMHVVFTPEAQRECAVFEQRWPQLGDLLVSVLSLDPRPAYRKGKTSDKVYVVRLYDLDIQWKILDEQSIVVIGLTLLTS